jgi:hypothetical protein
MFDSPVIPIRKKVDYQKLDGNNQEEFDKNLNINENISNTLPIINKYEKYFYECRKHSNEDNQNKIIKILSKVNKFLEKTENKLKKKEVKDRIKKDW